MRRALFINDCGLFWPSGMVRAMQYRSFFEASSNWHASYTSRHSEFVTRLDFEQRLGMRILLRPFRHQIAVYNKAWEKKQEDVIVNEAAKFDLVSIVKSKGLPLYERLIKLNKPRIIMDINDAVWLPFFGWDDLQETLSMVHGVICENEYIANYARKYNPKVFVVPDSPQIEKFDQYRSKIIQNRKQIVLGWIGGGQNLGPLFQIYEPLEALFKKYPQLHLRIVGADNSQLKKFKNVRYSCRSSFNQKEMVKEVLGFDIGLFPLFHNEDGLARGTLKAMVYMSGEACIVAENYGENRTFIRDGINGLLAFSMQEWYDRLDYLITHPVERSIIAKNGLETIRQKFTTRHNFERLIKVFEEV